jgi:hypothetical protein
MKKTLLTAITATALMAAMQPAFADHHQGGGDHHQSAGHSKMSAEEMMDGKAYAERSLDLLQAGNMMVEEGAKKKDHKMMMTGAKILKKGMHMHHMSMKGMKMMMHEMKHKVMHAKVGDTQMSDKEVADMEKMMKDMKATHDSYMGVCHKEMALVPKSAHSLLQAGNDAILKGMKEKNAEMVIMGSDMMEMGMALTHPHGMDEGDGHGSMQVEKRVEIKMHH